MNIASVAQPDRAPDFESVGWGFESLQGLQIPCEKGFVVANGNPGTLRQAR